MHRSSRRTPRTILPLRLARASDRAGRAERVRRPQTVPMFRLPLQGGGTFRAREPPPQRCFAGIPLGYHHRQAMQRMDIYGVSFDLVGKQPIEMLKKTEGNKFL